MRNIILAGAAALAFTATPAIADDHTEAEAYMMTDAQEADFMTWSDDKRITYKGWPIAAQEYYWTLTDMQKEGWWMLTDPQRVRIVEMTPQQRSTAWTQIAAQMNSSSTTATAATTASTSASASPRFVSKEVAQPITRSTAANISAEDLPVCTPNQQDGCINSWERNRTGTKPLDYWPGRPASQID